MSLSDRKGASLQLTNLVCDYGGAAGQAAAVDNVSLSVAPGEFLTFLGPSGSGKTTTLNMIAGFTEPTSGEILLDGSSVSRLPAHKREIGMVFQHYALFPHMTAANNVAFPLKQRKIPKETTAKLVDGSLERVGLKGYGHRYPRELSGGQQQRVALARAIVFGPRLLLMDEPLGALDKKLREGLQMEVRRLHRELGITFLYVTHDQDEALVLSDRIAIFNAGKVEQLGTPAELYGRPTTEFVADFLGESNILRGKLDGHGAAWHLVTPQGRFAVPTNGATPSNGAAAVVIRPERVRLSGAGTRDQAPNRVRGVVTDVMHLGTTRRLEVTVGDDARWLVRQLAGDDACPEIGSSVVLTWATEDAVVVAQ